MFNYKEAVAAFYEEVQGTTEKSCLRQIFFINLIKCDLTSIFLLWLDMDLLLLDWSDYYQVSVRLSMMTNFDKFA